MKRLLRSKLKKVVQEALREVLAQEASSVDETQDLIGQIALKNQYHQMLRSGLPLPALEDVGFSVHSENDEDGILLFLFSVLGTTNRFAVDIGAGLEGSNTANLVINHGWNGLLIEGDKQKADRINAYYQQCRSTKNYPPTVLNDWITRDNINDLLRHQGCEGEIDLLCIDMDGVDYYIWESLNCIDPRVVVVEYQCIWGPEKSVSVPYSDNFKGGFSGKYGVYSGASLAAFVKLGRRKGYRLVGCQRYGYNAFFVRNDLLADLLPEVSAKSCFKHPFTRWARDELLPEVKDREWVKI